MNEPERMTFPGSMLTPNSWSLLASQATALIGLPMTACADPDSIVSPLMSSDALTLRTSMSVSVIGRPPSTTSPHAAASEMLSTSIFLPRPLYRLSTISSAGSTKSVARITSAALTEGPRSGPLSTNANSTSTSGRFIFERLTLLPSGTNQLSNMKP